jgi:hypothetical protein
MWDVMESKLQNHVLTLSKECTKLEETVSSSKPTLLSEELQRYLAGNTQRIAKLVCTKADFEVIRKIVMSNDPTTVDWDEDVNKLRARYRNEFLVQVKDAAAKKHPITDLLIDEAREKFMVKLDMAIKVAMSKVSIGERSEARATERRDAWRPSKAKRGSATPYWRHPNLSPTHVRLST